MFRKVVLLMVLLSVSLLFAQSRERIVGSGEYYYGEYSDKNYQLARDYAIKNLSEKLVVYVRSSLSNKISETNTKASESMESIIQTHSIGTFKNLQEIKTPDSGKIKVLVYIKKTDLEEIFTERKMQIRDIYHQALTMENDGNIGSALKYYYFVMILMNSLPEERIEYNGVNYHVEVPNHINNIMRNITYQYQSREKVSDTEDHLMISMSYQNKPVSFLRFSFWDGSNQITIEGTDGRAILSLYGSSRNFDKIEINTEYQFYDSRNEIKVISDLWNLVKHPEFKNNFTLTLKDPKKKEEVNENKKSDPISLAQAECSEPLRKSIELQSNEFMALINKNNMEDIRKAYGDDPYLLNNISNLIKYNKIRIANKQNEMQINKTYDGWELRGLCITSRYPSVQKQNTDYLVLNFDENGKLVDVSFTLFKELYEEYKKNSSNPEVWTRNQIMIKFLEKYRTAYMTRDLSTIETLFSDDAVIIIGRVIKKEPLNKDIDFKRFGKEPDASYLKYTKNQYLTNLKRSFESNQDIFLGYNSLKVLIKNNQPDTYGISMRQNYQSSVYSDEGYLFLLVDFKDKEPKIYVRAWQPSEWSEEKMVQTANFKLN